MAPRTKVAFLRVKSAWRRHVWSLPSIKKLALGFNLISVRTGRFLLFQSCHAVNTFSISHASGWTELRTSPEIQAERSLEGNFPTSLNCNIPLKSSGWNPLSSSVLFWRLALRSVPLLSLLCPCRHLGCDFSKVEFSRANPTVFIHLTAGLQTGSSLPFPPHLTSLSSGALGRRQTRRG